MLEFEMGGSGSILQACRGNNKLNASVHPAMRYSRCLLDAVTAGSTGGLNCVRVWLFCINMLNCVRA